MFSRGSTPEDASSNSIDPNPSQPQTSQRHSPSPTSGRDPFEPATELTASTIGTDLTILGEKITIISKHQLQIDGDVRADINGKKVLIGQEGSVIGTVTAETIEVRGGLNGSIRARVVTLQPTAKVEGEIHHETLAIAEGAQFDGTVRRPKDVSELTPDLDPANVQNGSASKSPRATS